MQLLGKYFIVLASMSSLLTSCKHAYRERSYTKTLPNAGFQSGESSSLFDINLLKAFPKESFSTSVQLDKLSLQWILSDLKPSLLTRFGTLQLVSSSTGEKDPFRIGILHEAFDIIRSRMDLSDEIYAPASGLAKVVYDGNEDGSDSDPYSTALCIREEASHAVICMLHSIVSQDSKEKSRKGGFQVRRGDLVGRMAFVETMIEKYQEMHRHSHVSIFDIPGNRYVNPALHFPAYQDHVAPQVKAAYFLNEHAKRLSAFQSGKLDIVLEVFDQDDNRDRNFEVSYISFRLEDDQSRVLLEIKDCSIDAFSAPFPSKFVISNLLLDLGNGLPAAVNREWKEGKSDAAVPDRSFRYVLSHLKPKLGGGCSLHPSDGEGFIAISQEVQSLTLKGVIADWKGNQSDFSFTHLR